MFDDGVEVRESGGMFGYVGCACVCSSKLERGHVGGLRSCVW